MVDKGFTAHFGGADGAESQVQHLVELSNSYVYVRQVEVKLGINEMIIMDRDSSAAGTDNLEWNVPETTTLTIQNKLTAFSKWRGTHEPTRFGLWHLLTASYPTGVVGLAWREGICKSKQTNSGVIASSSTAITSVNTGGTWKTVAHEAGHNFGAPHSFENGQGTTGGIMDYGDGLVDGEYQFNILRKDDVCGGINQAIDDKKANNQFSNIHYVEKEQCIETVEPVCGNGVVEGYEICDHGGNSASPNPCCNSDCTGLIAGAECKKPDSCCSNTCKYKSTTTRCDFGDTEGAGYCSNGLCLQNI